MGGGGEVEGHIKESFVIMTCTVYYTLLTVFREFLGVINDRHLNNQCRVQSAEILISTFSTSKNDNKKSFCFFQTRNKHHP